MDSERPLSYVDPIHQEIAQFLVEEAYLLDQQDYARWLDLLTDDVRYVMPVRVATAREAGFDSLAHMSHFDEDLYSLRKRIARLATEHAWTEDPPSRMRHHITNILTYPLHPEQYRVESGVLLFRSRGDDRTADFVSAARSDVLVRLAPRQFRLRRRTIRVDESVLRTQNLAFLL